MAISAAAITDGKQSKPSMRQIDKPGDKLFVDYSALTVPVTEPTTGTVTDAQISVACLGRETTPMPKRPRAKPYPSG